MPIADVVIDTNVLLHANNTTNHRQQDAINLIQLLLASEILLCVDSGFAMDDSNRSLIGAEYKTYVKPGMLAYSFLVKILLAKRVRQCSAKTLAVISRKINQCISDEKQRDKTFLKVTYNSESKNFISHDYEDFKKKKRDYILETFGISMHEAAEFIALINQAA